MGLLWASFEIVHVKFPQKTQVSVDKKSYPPVVIPLYRLSLPVMDSNFFGMGENRFSKERGGEYINELCVQC